MSGPPRVLTAVASPSAALPTDSKADPTLLPQSSTIRLAVADFLRFQGYSRTLTALATAAGEAPPSPPPIAGFLHSIAPFISKGDLVSAVAQMKHHYAIDLLGEPPFAAVADSFHTAQWTVVSQAVAAHIAAADLTGMYNSPLWPVFAKLAAESAHGPAAQDLLLALAFPPQALISRPIQTEPRPQVPAQQEEGLIATVPPATKAFFKPSASAAILSDCRALVRAVLRLPAVPPTSGVELSENLAASTAVESVMRQLSASIMSLKDLKVDANSQPAAFQRIGYLVRDHALRTSRVFVHRYSPHQQSADPSPSPPRSLPANRGVTLRSRSVTRAHGRNRPPGPTPEEIETIVRLAVQSERPSAPSEQASSSGSRPSRGPTRSTERRRNASQTDLASAERAEAEAALRHARAADRTALLASLHSQRADLTDFSALLQRYGPHSPPGPGEEAMEGESSAFLETGSFDVHSDLALDSEMDGLLSDAPPDQSGAGPRRWRNLHLQSQSDDQFSGALDDSPYFPPSPLPAGSYDWIPTAPANQPGHRLDQEGAHASPSTSESSGELPESAPTLRPASESATRIETTDLRQGPPARGRGPLPGADWTFRSVDGGSGMPVPRGMVSIFRDGQVRQLPLGEARQGSALGEALLAMFGSALADGSTPSDDSTLNDLMRRFFSPE
jgi:hypothetical protein